MTQSTSAQVGERGKVLLQQRPLVQENVGAWPLQRHDGHQWCVGSAEIDRYVAVPREFYPIALEIVSLLDGTHTLEEVSQEIEHSYPGINRTHVLHFYEMLSRSGLILSPRPTYIYHSEVRKLSLDVASLNIARLTRILSIVLIRPVWWLLNLVALGFIVFATYTVILHPDIWSARTILVYHSYALGLAVSLLLTGLVVLWHEAGHGFTAVHYGLYPRALRIALYAGVVPLVYLDVHGLYTLPLRKRVILWLGGVWANLFGAAILIMLVTQIPMPLLAQQIIWKLILVNIMFIPANLSPFMPTDGYFIFCNIVGQFNLRTHLLLHLQERWRDRQLASSSPIGSLAWIYVIISIAILFVGGIFWLWWIWHICLELYMAVSGPLLFHWAGALLIPVMLALGLIFLGMRKRRVLSIQTQQAQVRAMKPEEANKSA